MQAGGLRGILGLALFAAAFFVAGCDDEQFAAAPAATVTVVLPSLTPTPAATATPTIYTEPREACAQHNPLRNVYFGDLHVHTINSFDAHIFEVRTTPEQAYAFARGATVALPPLDANGEGTRSLRLERPLDFAAVTDHSEFLGEVDLCSTPGSPAYDSPNCQIFRGDEQTAVRRFGALLTMAQPRLVDVCGADGQRCLTRAADVWTRIQSAADGAYDRSAQCAFTSFVAYEYSNSGDAATRHRNVIFRNDHVPFPTSFYEEPTAQGLWRELHATCLDAGTGCDVLAIPHNSNESNGRMFLVEYPGATTLDEERAQAAARAAIEPVVEVYQHKGDSECMNGLSGVIGGPDEFCDFEKRRVPPFTDCGDGTGAGGTTGLGCVSRLDFVRGVLLAGLKEEERLGANPYRLGMIGSTDTHNGTPGATEEHTFIGHRGTDDGTIEDLLGQGQLTPGGIIFSPGGLAAVWAEENSRPAIFDALRRREVFATSGVRIAVRFFSGWDLPTDLCGRADMLQQAYDNGVPMGATLPPRPADATRPTFVVAALRDPGTATRTGALLQRVQIVKGWIEDGEAHQQVIEVAGTPDNGASVDLDTCEPQGPGDESLCATWTDMAFNPNQHAFYYARVLENPSCRWNTYVCNSLPPEQLQPSCTDPKVPKTIQERAWSSPIWYVPPAG